MAVQNDALFYTLNPFFLMLATLESLLLDYESGMRDVLDHNSNTALTPVQFLNGQPYWVGESVGFQWSSRSKRLRLCIRSGVHESRIEDWEEALQGPWSNNSMVAALKNYICEEMIIIASRPPLAITDAEFEVAKDNSDQKED
jgi:hypothetical protein